VAADGKGLLSTMVDMGMVPERRRTNRVAAAILARVICPERADWSTQAARELLQLRFAAEDLDRFHGFPVLLSSDSGSGSIVI
jgi:hypothetical protein